MTCPVCEGEGTVNAIGYDSETHAAGLEAYGIGDSLSYAENFIAHAPSDLALLLSIVERQREALEFYARNAGLRINHATNKFESSDSDERDFHGALARECIAEVDKLAGGGD